MVVKWFIAVLAVLGGFAVALVAGAVVAELVGLWGVPGAGFSAAFTVVVIAYLAAPAYKLPCASLVFVIGALIAWLLLEQSFYPESYREVAYQPTLVPLILTYAGGLLGLFITAVMWRQRATSDMVAKPR